MNNFDNLEHSYPPGTKVKVIDTNLSSNDVYTIEEYLTNTCGEGCCDGYKLKEIGDCLFWECQLFEIKE